MDYKVVISSMCSCLNVCLLETLVHMIYAEEFLLSLMSVNVTGLNCHTALKLSKILVMNDYIFNEKYYCTDSWDHLIICIGTCTEYMVCIDS